MTKPAKSSAAAEAPCTGSARRVSPMKLLVRVVEARGLQAVHVDGSSDPFVKLQLGKRHAKTAVAKRSLAPAWDEEFSFLVADVAEELVVTVLNEDKYFSNDVLGQVRVPLNQVMDIDDLSLDTAWYQLQPKSKKSKKKCRGIIAVARFFDLLSFSLFIYLFCLIRNVNRRLVLLFCNTVGVGFFPREHAMLLVLNMLHSSD
jgi:hypothetical protein